MSIDPTILKLLRQVKRKINHDLRNFDERCRREAYEIVKKGFLKKKEPKKAILLLRSLQGQPSEIVEEHRAILLEACERQNFQIIEIFYYTLGDSTRRANIIRYIKSLGEKVALVTNHINPKVPGKSGKKVFKRLVQQNYIDVYKLIYGQLCLVYTGSTQRIGG